MLAVLAYRKVDIMGIFDASNTFAGQEFKKIVLKNEQVSQKEFDNCKFTRCTFQETAFLNCKFTECVFLECDLRLVNLKGSSFSETRFEQSEVTGINWTETTWRTTRVLMNKPVDFISCVLNYCVFIGLNMTNIQITHCTAKSVAFDEANLTKANCTYTDFADSRFARTNLTQADFTGAKNYLIDVQQNTVKKTKFSLPDALALLNSFDIILSDASGK